MTNMINGIKTKAILIGIMAVSILISGCGVKKDSDDKVMLVIGKTITEVTSDGQETLLDTRSGRYWQYDSGNSLLIASSKYYTTNVSIYNLETGAETDIGFQPLCADWRNARSGQRVHRESGFDVAQQHIRHVAARLS